MECSRIISITTADKTSIALPEHIMNAFVECAVKTTMHTLYDKDVKALIERNKDNHMNFANALFTTVNADDKWQYQFLSFANATLNFDPQYIQVRLIKAEEDMINLKEDLLILMKCFFAFSDSDMKAMDYMGIELEDWHRLSEKYLIDKSDLVDIAWTFPYLALMILRVYAAVERPVGMNMLWDYPGFRLEMRFMGLLGIVPRYGKCGGFIKALLHHAVLQVQKGLCMKTLTHGNAQRSMNAILHDILGLARSIYHTEVNDFCTREEFFQYLNITVENMQDWSMAFNAQYPEHWDVHIKYFEQTD